MATDELRIRRAQRALRELDNHPTIRMAQAGEAAYSAVLAEGRSYYWANKAKAAAIAKVRAEIWAENNPDG